MTFRVSPGMKLLFGSETRAKVLGLLADTREPRSGYQVSKALGIGPPKVYRVLRQLEGAGFLRAVVTGSGVRRFYLADDDLRRLLLKRVRIALQDDWFAPEQVEGRERALAVARRITVAVPKVKGAPKSIPNPQEFVRPRKKDRIVARAMGRRRDSR